MAINDNAITCAKPAAAASATAEDTITTTTTTLPHCLGFDRGRYCMVDGRLKESVPNDGMWMSNFVSVI